jgi:hypothetical protein
MCHWRLRCWPSQHPYPRHISKSLCPHLLLVPGLPTPSSPPQARHLPYLASARQAPGCLLSFSVPGPCLLAFRVDLDMFFIVLSLVICFIVQPVTKMHDRRLPVRFIQSPQFCRCLRALFLFFACSKPANAVHQR